MRKSIEINGKIYTPARFEIDEICRMEEMGVPIGEMGARQLSLLRSYVAITIDCDKEDASKEIQAHLEAGKTLDDIFDCIKEAQEESGFFRALSKGETEETPQVEESAKPKKSSK